MHWLSVVQHDCMQMHELLLHSCRFHGIEPSKKSKEKIQRKVRDEMAAKKAATSEQPAGTLNHLKHAQVPSLPSQLCHAAATAFSCSIRDRI